MIGRSRTYAAISVVNALAGGLGAAIGIDLPLEVDAELVADRSIFEVEPDASNTAIVRACAEGSIGPGVPTEGLRLRIRSEIPAARGLKSSSAVGMGVWQAVASARGERREPRHVAVDVARVAREIGQSATGALDDNLAASIPGVWVTDNRRDTVLRHDAVPEGLEVALWVPPATHPASPTLVDRIRGLPGNLAGDLAKEGRWWAALEANSDALEPVLGRLPVDRARLHEQGAVAVGFTGLGPTVAIVAPYGRYDALVEVLPPDGATVVRCAFRRTDRRPERSR